MADDNLPRPGLKQETKRGTPHYCEHPGCTEWGSFGYGSPGIEWLFKPAKWYCAGHRPDLLNPKSDRQGTLGTFR